MKKVMEKIELNEKTEVHGVGDGALWITEQGEKIAGSKYKHLIDLFHLCDYIVGAVTAWTAEVEKEVKRLKALFEEGRVDKALLEFRERKKQKVEHEALRVCIQYIENRPGQFEYKKAKEKELPMVWQGGKQSSFIDTKTAEKTRELVVKRKC